MEKLGKGESLAGVKHIIFRTATRGGNYPAPLPQAVGRQGSGWKVAIMAGIATKCIRPYGVLRPYGLKKTIGGGGG